MQKLLFASTLAFGILTGAEAQQEPFLNPSLSIDARVQDLIGRMTPEEKIYQMMNNSPAIKRLHVPEYDWWNEALHGVARSGIATIFPQPIGMAATFDDALVHQVADAISDEARAMYNAAVKKDYRPRFAGLTFWTPNINIFRDPRWGRGEETYGEDPYLTARMGVALVTGFQGSDPRYLKVAACAKHYAVHSGPERLRHQFDAEVSKKDLWETYLPAFHALVNAKVEAVMCAYNRTDGEACCANTYLLEDVLRKQWGFKGHIVSDCDAIADIYEGHKLVNSKMGAAALALQRGVNLNCGDTYLALGDALKQGLVTQKLMDSSLAVLLRTRFKLGLFDPAGSNPYDRIPESVINSPEHRALSRKVAEKSIVLLKNDGALPLSTGLKKYYVTGPNAAAVDVLLGNYYGVNPQLVTFLEGLAAQVQPGSQMTYRQGVLLDRPNVNPIDWASGESGTADATIAVLGISSLLEGEEGESLASPFAGDRLDYNLPAAQIDYLRKLKKNTRHPLIAVVTGGSPMNLAEVQEIADAVLLVWYPGEEGGNALADIIFGKVSPSGKLPVTFPRSFEQLPAYEDYSMKGRTYRYMIAEPLYPFGFGLSYTQFAYSDLRVSKDRVHKDESVTVGVTLTNTGKMASDEVAELYLTHEGANDSEPLFALKGFERVSLAPGASKKLSFVLTAEQLSLVDANGKSFVPAGKVRISVGGSLPTARSVALGAGQGVNTEIEILSK
ncbi:MAG TPA: glycoside hydrolase family 3 C-terminal domain-containing protein [Puia sp.]|uniref:glycoside hydrolase family 3 C-terminal domain-containing protein n=1 Tax=Puia sp. TaxID=2045100 RepID=UPI002B86FB03|nr:glycoside hydrolase family 3 C-terminal domain-containing protein [Puia sp.]HVU98568.1 glycoside hydrolase family 3 C-terminal domain-containing protein [Puia sp.]